LLEKFVARRDEAAFAALVRRHGPMVLGVCRRILGNEQDAEDAFQATFLVFCRRAGSLRPKDSLSAWLYIVAYRAAQKARVAAARRRKHEALSPEKPVADPLAQISLREGAEMLERELARMPEKLRTPLILCYLEGLTRDEAAERLGCPLTTLKSRLEKARNRLRARLASRGVSLPTIVASLLCEGTTSAVPTVLFSLTVNAAVRVAAHNPITSVVSAEVAALTQGLLRSMYLNKARASAAAFLACLAIGGAILATFRTSAAGQQGHLPQVVQGPPDARAPDLAQPNAKRAVQAGPNVDAVRAKAVLARLQGTWTDGVGEDLLIVDVKGDSIKWNKQVLKITIVGFDGDVTHADLLVEEGSGKGETYKAILCVGKDVVHWCCTSDVERPVEFKTVPKGETRYVSWKRIKEKPGRGH